MYDFQTITLEPGQKIAKYNFDGAVGISVDFTVTSQTGQETTVVDVKAEVCAEPPGKVYIIWTSMRENLILLHTNNKGTAQPGHLRILVSAFVISCRGKYKSQTCSMQNFSSLASHCSWADWFYCSR